jgi:hypothetical protein
LELWARWVLDRGQLDSNQLDGNEQVAIRLMAKLEVNANDVVVHLSRVEAVAACRREVRVPVRHLTMVHVEDCPLAVVSLLRLPGLAWPGAFVLGSRRRDGRHEFVAVRAGPPAVVLDAEGTLWDRVVVSHPDAVDIAAELAALLLGRGPGKTGNGDRGHGGRERRRRTRQVGSNGLTLDRAGVSARTRAGAGVSV